MAAVEVGQNVSVTVKENKLTIEVDLTQDFGKKEGKALNKVASTGGFVHIPGANGHTMQVFVGKRDA